MVHSNSSKITTAAPTSRRRALRARHILRVPKGWKIVPEFPDIAMTRAAWHASKVYSDDFHRAYKAAVAAVDYEDMPFSGKFYWQDAMSRRMPFEDEVTRLRTVLSGFHYQYANAGTLADTWASDRPYGDKNIPASIAFNLGWDYARRLCLKPMPEWVEAKAMELHNAVLASLLPSEHSSPQATQHQNCGAATPNNQENV